MSLVVQVIIRKGLAIVPLVVLEGGPNRNLLSLEMLEERCTPANLFWNPVGGITGNFSTVANWDQDSVGGPVASAIPGPNDTANFTIAEVNCTVDVNARINDLEVTDIDTALSIGQGKRI